MRKSRADARVRTLLDRVLRYAGLAPTRSTPEVRTRPAEPKEKQGGWLWNDRPAAATTTLCVLARDPNSEEQACFPSIDNLRIGSAVDTKLVEEPGTKVAAPEGGAIGIEIEGKPAVFPSDVVALNQVAGGIKPLHITQIGHQHPSIG